SPPRRSRPRGSPSPRRSGAAASVWRSAARSEALPNRELIVMTANATRGGGLTGALVVALVVALALALAGCGQSVLIHNSDASYPRAIEHLQRTRQLVTESLAPEDDQAIFLQAEGFFRYRFAPPGRSFGSYIAQATASIIDLPVLDSLAGSLDLYSLR